MQSTTNSIIRRAAVFGTGIVLGLSAMSGVASAAPAGRHASHTTFTEDNDTNDKDTPNNQVDDGDNRHPSGKDRSVEHGGSGNQGKASSDPDDDGRGPDRSNGGIDQPNEAGGRDLADQDGNNGCGNDDDFEDDNEGWCGKPKPAPAPASEVNVEALAVVVSVPVVVSAVPVATEVVTPAVEVLAVQAEAAPALAGAAEVATVPEARVVDVLGVSIEKSNAEAQVLGVIHERGALARTGFELIHFIVAAMALLALGLGMKRFGRTA